MGGWYSHTTITIQEYSVLKVSTKGHVKKPNLKGKKVKINCIYLYQRVCLYVYYSYVQFLTDLIS